MKAEEITDWIIKIGIDEFQTIDKQVQFKKKLEAYAQTVFDKAYNKGYNDAMKGNNYEY